MYLELPAEGASESDYAEVTTLKTDNANDEEGAVHIVGLLTPPATPPLQSKSASTPASTPVEGLTPISTPKASPRTIIASKHQRDENRVRPDRTDAKPVPDTSTHNNRAAQKVKADIPPASMSKPPENVYGNVASDELLSKPIKITEFKEHVQQMLNREAFLEEFRVMHNVDRYSYIIKSVTQLPCVLQTV